MQEAIDAIRAAPLWAQAGMALFALAFLAMVIAPRARHRRARERFSALARARGAQVTPGRDEFAESFSVEHGGRPFTIRRELRSSARGSSYRGPRGHLVVTETPLSGSRWKVHNVDIAQQSVPAWLGRTPLASGDAQFDARFRVRQDGVPVREDWLDERTRDVFSSFFDLPVVAGAGAVWVQEGVLQYIHDDPGRLDHAGLTQVLERQAALADALEATAGWRGPAA